MTENRILSAFSSAVLIRIRNDDPELDLEALAREVLAKRDSGATVKSIDGLLIAWSRRALAEQTYRKGKGQGSGSEPKPWGFDRDGTFRDDGRHHRRVTECIRTLILERRAHPFLGPQRIAEQAITLARDVPELRDAIGEATLIEWLNPRKHLDAIPPHLRALVGEPEDHELWPQVPTGTGAAEAIKRAVRVDRHGSVEYDHSAEVQTLLDAF